MCVILKGVNLALWSFPIIFIIKVNSIKYITMKKLEIGEWETGWYGNLFFSLVLIEHDTVYCKCFYALVKYSSFI